VAFALRSATESRGCLDWYAGQILHSAAEGGPGVGAESSLYDAVQSSLSKFPSQMNNLNRLGSAHFLGNPVIYI
jgi:hypothetical protein